MEELTVLNNFKKDLDSTGCGFCLAKWTQVTIHLQTGRTHSCHHPDTHPIPLKEISRNPSALHNTRFKKLKRKEMLENQRPSECQYCWNVEDSSNHLSDRILKSHEPWSLPYLDDIRNLNWREDFNPRYVEVAFSNTCNFKCSYCGPSFSTKWVAESEKFGGYPTETNFNGLERMKAEGRMPFNPTDPNPYVDAFWKWWPYLYQDLHTFRMTGGEPLLSKDVWQVLEYIVDHPNPNRNLNLSINSNLGVPDDLVEKLIKTFRTLEDEQRVNELVLYTSVDGWGAQAEYGRFGLEFNRFWSNIRKVLEACPTVTIGIMSTYNALSVSSFSKLIQEVYELKAEFASPDRAWTTPVALDASYLRYPLHQTVQVLPKYFAEQVQHQGTLMDSLQEVFHENTNNLGVSYGYTQMEIPKMKRIYDWMISPQDQKQLLQNRIDFYRFFTEHDRRRGTDFVSTFPELADFFNYCKELQHG